jgi:hypothetical protein
MVFVVKSMVFSLVSHGVHIDETGSFKLLSILENCNLYPGNQTLPLEEIA